MNGISIHYYIFIGVYRHAQSKSRLKFGLTLMIHAVLIKFLIYCDAPEPGIKGHQSHQ